jgi:hypothetical protein
LSTKVSALSVPFGVEEVRREPLEWPVITLSQCSWSNATAGITAIAGELVEPAGPCRAVHDERRQPRESYDGHPVPASGHYRPKDRGEVGDGLFCGEHL